MYQPTIPRGFNPIADAEIRREAEHDAREARELAIGRDLRESTLHDDDAAETFGDMDVEQVIAAMRQACEQGRTEALHRVWDELIDRTAKRLA